MTTQWLTACNSIWSFMAWSCVELLCGIMVGMIFGKIMAYNQWGSKGDPKHRTAMYHKGEFYYVITEKEYCGFLTKSCKDHKFCMDR